ncbi:MAG: sulfotransferase family protein, partial [Bacteroidia bacterium]
MTDSNWMPVQFRYENGQAEIRWMYFGQLLFREPFFEETMARCKQLDENKKIVWTPIDVLLRSADAADCIKPNLFIFHV